MIDHEVETVLSLTDAAARLPRRRGGKRVNVATLYRWASNGCRGVRLETIQIGGTRCTSMQALQRFFDRLSTPGAGPVGPDHRREARVRQRDERVERELAARGI